MVLWCVCWDVISAAAAVGKGTNDTGNDIILTRDFTGRHDVTEEEAEVSAITNTTHINILFSLHTSPLSMILSLLPLLLLPLLLLPLFLLLPSLQGSIALGGRSDCRLRGVSGKDSIVGLQPPC